MRFLGLTILAVALSVGVVRAEPPIPPGTQITVQNWRTYEQYLPEGMKVLFAGQFVWKMPANAALEVAPTSPVHLPPKFFQDTEKYNQQVKLRPVGNGGFLIDGYVAGLPFPNPQEPDLGEKLLYDTWYRYQPWVETGRVSSAEIDRYGNVTNTVVSEVNYKLNHLSDVGVPTTYPGGEGIFNVANLVVDQPEQSKYTTNLVIVPEDLTKDQENYVFLPSLRRSLRLSTAARCSPLVGGDYTSDDINLLNIQIPNFTVKSLGDRKILMVLHAKNGLVNSTNYTEFTRLTTPPLMWPRSAYAKWEIRDAYVIDIRPTPAYLHGYCYSRRVLYIDKETFQPQWVDLYDANGKLWKTGPALNHIQPVPGGGEAVVVPAGAWYELWDVENGHASISVPMQLSRLTSDVQPRYLNLQRYATPAGLDQVMQ
jgi:hypothetical protein